MADELEELKNMSPEQLRELQKKQCIFCRITEGKVQARKVYEDEYSVAVLDINPGTPGHMLLMPKEHYSILPQLPEELIAHLGIVAKHLSQAALRALKAQGTTIFAANGLAAGQRASHLLVHIIPRMEGDGAGILLPEKEISEKDARNLRDQLQPIVNRAFGKETVEKKHTPEIKRQEKAPEKKAETEKQQEKAEQKKDDKNERRKPNLDEIADFLGGKR
ncbi:MAG TPA: HIT domain-containing protein [Candidatus Binatia bacterium]|nr:HIT domain-containing protein [Candidatus Binatia bacterium]